MLQLNGAERVRLLYGTATTNSGASVDHNIRCAALGRNSAGLLHCNLANTSEASVVFGAACGPTRPVPVATLGAVLARFSRRVNRSPSRSPLQMLDVARGDGFRRVGVALNVSLGAVAHAPFELVGIGAGEPHELKREGMA